ncbi:MAG TPA: hypothetical protein VHG28_23330 [Longimicrobiaceae bacterium]|nr:hypothetical protein [Longimicrobiaceae bacterium]
MRQITRLGLRTVFAAAVAAALGLGASQALASPGTGAPARQTCDYRCNQDCIRANYSWGACDPTTNRCYCFND